MVSFGGKLNASVNYLDRFINTPTRNKAAIIWEADSGVYKTFTYQQLSREVNRFANVLKKKGCKKGDRVTILPAHDPGTGPSPCWPAHASARSTLWYSGGSSAKSLRDRIQDCQSTQVRSWPGG